MCPKLWYSSTRLHNAITKKVSKEYVATILRTEKKEVVRLSEILVPTTTLHGFITKKVSEKYTLPSSSRYKLEMMNFSETLVLTYQTTNCDNQAYFGRAYCLNL
jgi:hypothetical protein